MNRLTEWTGEGWIPVQERQKGKIIGYKDCMNKLAAYENTGFEPEEIEEIKEKITPKKPDEVLLHAGTGYECRECGNELSVNEYNGNYCNWCGQKLVWE